MPLYFVYDRPKMYLFPWYICDVVATRDMKVVTGGPVLSEAFCVLVGDYMTIYYDLDSVKKMSQTLLKKIIDDETYGKMVLNKIYELSDNLEVFTKKVYALNNLENLSDQELSIWLENYVKVQGESRTWGRVPAFLDGIEDMYLTNLIMEKLKEVLREKGLEDRVSEYYSILTSADKMSSVKKEELMRIELLSKIESLEKGLLAFQMIKDENIKEVVELSSDIRMLLELHLKNYGWLTYGYSGPAMSLEHLGNLLKENLDQGKTLMQQKNDLLNSFTKAEEEKKKMISDLNLNSQMKYILHVSSELMLQKDFRKGVNQDSYLAIDRILTELGKRMGLSLLEIKYLTDGEIKEAVLNKNYFHYQEICKQRVEKCCYLCHNGIIEVYEGEVAEKMIAKKMKEIIKKDEISADTIQIKGMTAYKGKVTGVAKIVLVVADIDKIKEGEILVSSSTNPDLLLAMKKASAFVTNTGGIISHAAIVSRELKKPCVVGTRVATHLIKDGDLIEVDADKGVVNILKKA